MKVVFHPDTPFAPEDFTPVDPARVIAGAPMSAHKVIYTSESGEMCSGAYASTPGKWRVSYTEDEFCTLISGEVILTPEGGESAAFKAPDSFMIPRGFVGTWESVTPVHKFFVIYEKT